MDRGQQAGDNAGSSRYLNRQPMYTLVDIPIELLVYIIYFVISASDRVKFRYVSQRLRAAVETPSLWRDFSWPHFDFRQERAIKIALKSYGRHVKRLSFPNLKMIPVELLQYCGNVLRLSLPSAKLCLNQLRTVMQFMKKLQYLDILWASKNDIKHLLLMVGYPINGCAIKELTIREQVKDSWFDEALHFLLNEWTALRLTPRTINIVTSVSSVLIRYVVGQWVHFGSADHIGYLNIYRCFTVGFIPIPPMFQYQIFGPRAHCLNLSFVLARNYGLLGLTDSDHILLTNRTIDNGDVLHKGTMSSSVQLQGTPLNIISIKFLTHFSAAGCSFFYSGHLEQLAIVCPNLQQLDLRENVNCLSNLQGLCVIATVCQKLKGLNITGISVEEVENYVKLWEILVDLQLTYISIDLCCLLCFEDDHTKQIIIGLHQKCLKMKALESHCFINCTKCVENKQALQLSNFPLLTHCVTTHINDVNICERLKCLWYTSENIWWPWSIANCNLQELCIESDQLALPHRFMDKISAHGGLVHVILNVNSVNLNGIATLIGNSPNLITCHVYIRWSSCYTTDFMSTLKKYSERKLFLWGSYCLLKGDMPTDEFHDLLVHGNLDLVSLWQYAL